MRVSFGRYIAYDSPVHRMEPRAKLLMLIMLMVSIFLPTGFTGYIIIAFFIFGLYFLAKLRCHMLWILLRPILFMFTILLLINCFLLKSGIDLGWNVGNSKVFVLSEKAIYSSLYMSFRIYLMILITTILTSTTRPLDLTIALEDLLSPLKLVRFPVHILSTIISIALRMIPTLIEEANRILKAQASRGIDFRNGKFKEKIKATTSLIIPLLVSAFQKAEDLADAMDSRGYDPHSTRTRYRVYRLHLWDVTIFLVGMCVAGIIIAQSVTMGNFETCYSVWHLTNSGFVFGPIKTGFLQIRLPHLDDFILGI